MATRNLLHKSQLNQFEQWLKKRGYKILSTSKNYFEVLRAFKDGNHVIIYRKANSAEHLSIMDKDYKLIREFITERKAEHFTK